MQLGENDDEEEADDRDKEEDDKERCHEEGRQSKNSDAVAYQSEQEGVERRSQE